MNELESIKFRSLLKEIINGCSLVNIGPPINKKAYIKHNSFSDDCAIDEYYLRFYEKALEQGVPTKDERLKQLSEDGSWSQKDDAEISKTKSFLENLVQTKKKLVIQQQKNQIQAEIEKAEKKIHLKELELAMLINQTCESYASSKQHDYLIMFSFFEDEKMSKRLFTEEEFDYMNDVEISALLTSYIDYINKFAIENIKKLALANFFTDMFYILPLKSASLFFDKKPFEMTRHESNLFQYARALRSIIEEYPNMPEAIKNDPNKIFEYHDRTNKGKELVDKYGNKSAMSIVGATKQDMEDMGINTAGTETPIQMLKRSGKSVLKKKDLI